jgi:cell wall-associated NlpC family hydrolase
MFGLGLHGNYLRRADGGDGGFAGISADLTALKGGGQGPYLVAGVGGGMGSPHSGDFTSVWGSWSAGAGYELFPASFLAFGAEARWRELSLDHRDGLEVAAGLSIRFGGPSRPRPARPVPSSSQPVAEPPLSSPGATDGVEGKPVPLRESVIATATDAMGRPYRWGGTGADGGGFDCSGLIQHAYGQHGIGLPRTSAEQAKQGKAVSKKLGSLLPGDLLTFSNRGGPVSHVGLYIGEGRFIHSASRGVQISVLSGEDPYGRWWFTRWVGVRRIIDD